MTGERWMLALSLALSLATGCGDPVASAGEASATDGTGDTESTGGTASTGAPPSSSTGEAGADAGTGGATSTGEAGSATSSSTAGESGSSGEPADDGSDSATTGFEPPGDALFYEPFDAPDGSAWPEHWSEVGGVIAHEVVDGRGRLQGQTRAVGRMVHVDFDGSDVDLSATVIFDDFGSQGFGLYVRHNGGYLTSTMPPGFGYAAFVEGGFSEQLGVWREYDGYEQMLSGTDVAPLEAGVAYRMRLRCVQETPMQTRLQAKLWPLAEPEPVDWAVDILDGTRVLQSVGGTIAVDIYNYEGEGSLLVDDVVVAPAR